MQEVADTDHPLAGQRTAVDGDILLHASLMTSALELHASIPTDMYDPSTKRRRRRVLVRRALEVDDSRVGVG